MAKKPYIPKDVRAKLEAIRRDALVKGMADKGMPAEVRAYFSRMSLEDMLTLMGVETQKPKSEDANAHITILPAITRTSNVRIAKGSMGAYETLTPAAIHYIQDSGLGDYYFNVYFLRNGTEKFKVACCLGDSIDGVYGRNMRNQKVMENLPPSAKRISPTLYKHVNFVDDAMYHNEGYVNTVNFGQGHKDLSKI